MSKLENITDKIKDEALEKAEGIQAKANEEISRLENEAKVEIEEMEKKAMDDAQKKANSERNKILSQAQLKARDEELGAKNDLLDLVFDKAKDKLKNITDEEYLTFVKKTLEGVENLEGYSLVPQEGRKDLLKDLSIDVSEDESVESGFALRKGNILSNYTFDALVDFYRSQTEGEVASILFDRKG